VYVIHAALPERHSKTMFSRQISTSFETCWRVCILLYLFLCAFLYALWNVLWWRHICYDHVKSHICYNHVTWQILSSFKTCQCVYTLLYLSLFCITICIITFIMLTQMLWSCHVANIKLRNLSTCIRIIIYIINVYYYIHYYM